MKKVKNFLEQLEEKIEEQAEEVEELEEINAIGTGAVVGYTLPLGMKSPFKKTKAKKANKQWYEITKENLEKKQTLKIQVKDDDGNLVANAVVLYDGKIAYFDSVVLTPEYRNKGLGKKLYKLVNMEVKKKFGVPLSSSKFLTKNSKRVWNSFERTGDAKKIDHETYMMEQVEVYGEYNWGLHPVEGPKWWNMFIHQSDKLYYNPKPFTKELYEKYDFGKEKGAWVPFISGKHFIVAIPAEKTIYAYTSLFDPRLAYTLSTSFKHIPEIADFVLKIINKNSTDGIEVGTVGKVLKRIKNVSFKSPAWNSEREEKYEDFKLEILQDVDEINWFHATTLNKLQSILSNGLRPSGDTAGWSIGNINLQNAVYLTADKDYALDIAETLLARTGEPGLVLKIFGRAIKDKEKVVVDEDSLRNQFDDMISAGLLQPGMPDYLTSVLDEKITALGYKDTINQINFTPVFVVDAERENGRFKPDSDVEVYTWNEWRRASRSTKINEQKKTKKKTKVPFPYFEPYDHDMDPFDIFVTKLDPGYKLGKVEEIDLYDPDLFATQKYVENETMEKQRTGEWEPSSKFPVVIDFYDGKKYIQDGHHRLSSAKLSGMKTAKAFVIPRGKEQTNVWSERLASLNMPINEEMLGVNGGVRYFQIGSSLPTALYNRDKNGKPTRDPGIAFLRKRKKKK